MAINPAFHAAARPEWDVPGLLDGLKRGDRQTLARAITLVESRRAQDQAFAQELLDQLQPKTPSARAALDCAGPPCGCLGD
ncbi:MAG: hypothetical protein EBZ22_01110 [Flavobacteriia bacterium]|nr:hypothetical protein [Flavobacteriia bacterium]